MSLSLFGQLVVGPPGSGKTTYVAGMQQALHSLGRQVCVVNLDPAANPHLPYISNIDIRELITVEEVMEQLQLGPNGALIYCMEYLASNLHWLKQQVEQQQQHNNYLLIDFPGQVELYTCSSALTAVFSYLADLSTQHLTVINLVDSCHLQSPETYLSILLLSLATMMKLAFPHINVLTKIDLLSAMGELPQPFTLEYYTEATDLNLITTYIQEQQEAQTETLSTTDDKSSRYRHYQRLPAVLCELVESYNLVSFSTLDIQDKQNVLALIKLIDTSNGYAYLATQQQQQQGGTISMFNMVRQHQQQQQHGT